jgi:hypothetical protein
MKYLDLMTELRTLLAPVLGVYRRNNGDTFPAIIGLLDEEQRPAEYRPEGLECIIRRSPFVMPKSTLCDGVQFSQTWRVYLLQWPNPDGTPSAALEVASRVLAQRWGGDFSGMPQEPDGNAQDQFFVKIRDYTELIESEDAIA